MNIKEILKSLYASEIELELNSDFYEQVSAYIERKLEGVDGDTLADEFPSMGKYLMDTELAGFASEFEALLRAEQLGTLEEPASLPSLDFDYLNN